MAAPVSAAAGEGGPASPAGSGASGPSGARSALRRLGHYVRRNRTYYAVWLLLTLAYVGGFVAVPMLVGWAVAAFAEGLPPAEVGRRCAILAAVAVLRGGLRYGSRVLVFNAAREIEYEIRNDLFQHLQRMPQSFYFRWRTGELMSRCTNDLNAVRLLLGVGLLNMTQTPVLYVAVMSAMFALNWKLTLLVLIPYPLFVVVGRYLGRAIHQASIGTLEGLAELSNQLQESIAGIAAVKAYAMEGATAERFDRTNEALYHRHLRMVRANAAMPAAASLLPGLAMWIVLWAGGNQILDGTMTLAEFFTFAMFIYELTFPTVIMGFVVSLIQRGSASMERIDHLLSIDPSIATHAEPEPVERLAGEIEFEHLTFRYPGAEREAALCDVSLRVPAGTTLGVVGPVGSGKTTLASVIPRLYEVDDGQLRLDGVDVNRIPLPVLRSAIAMVPQESFLFSRSLAENIAYGLDDADAERLRGRVHEAAERAQLAKDVRDLPGGYETVVGERGVMLSGGQRQRTALARALALRPSILILDDTLSAVDAETEAAIQAELREVFRGRTVVVVSSRVSAVREADQIVVLDEGRIVERGTHADLLAQGGLYARLAQEQEREAALSGIEDVA